MTNTAETSHRKDVLQRVPSCPDGTACAAVWATVLKVALAAVAATVFAVVLIAALGAACSTLLPVPGAYASEASVEVTLLPLENDAEEGDLSTEGTPPDKPLDDHSEQPAEEARAASLAQTGDPALRSVPIIALAALASAVALALGYCQTRTVRRHERADEQRHGKRIANRWRRRSGTTLQQSHRKQSSLCKSCNDPSAPRQRPREYRQRRSTAKR
ncbi:MAG TPA: hypothetical protein IAA95_06140 [Candidatus Aveggerthella excrementigallinarum]|nr:hypothetical protein [Candidatus Aveggerthella excrementigallinarum]